MNVRITQRDVAREAGVSHVTVSLALRESPSIPEETRKTIKDIALRLGYSPDPMLTALSSYRSQQRPAAHHANIAWLYSHLDATSKGKGDFATYYCGAEDRARQLGYILDQINITGEYADPKRLRRLLEARNITGLVLAPCSNDASVQHEFHFDLSHYSAVRIGYSYRAPLLNTIANAQFRTSLVAVQRAIAMGYERIGILLTREVDERTSWQFLGGYLAGIHSLPRKNWIDPFYVTEVHWQSAFIEWVLKQRIDCVIGAGFGYILNDMARRGIRVPEDVGYVDTQIPQGNTVLTGIDQNPRHIGVAAIDLLVSMMHRYDVGIPAVASHLLIEGSWHNGATTGKKMSSPVPAIT
jgi:DNA-binding LacI/PurR family transcriptional regulator